MRKDSAPKQQYGQAIVGQANPIVTASDPKDAAGTDCGHHAKLVFQTAGEYQLARETGKGAKKGRGRLAQNKEQ